MATLAQRKDALQKEQAQVERLQEKQQVPEGDKEGEKSSPAPLCRGLVPRSTGLPLLFEIRTKPRRL